ncbi:MAG TPA: hypothetical protein VJ183_11520 [Chloroflexia bacterium]|nr:hypothetical protein [Chloroflexia bacterium]
MRGVLVVGWVRGWGHGDAMPLRARWVVGLGASALVPQLVPGYFPLCLGWCGGGVNGDKIIITCGG